MGNNSAIISNIQNQIIYFFLTQPAYARKFHVQYTWGFTAILELADPTDTRPGHSV